MNPDNAITHDDYDRASYDYSQQHSRESRNIADMVARDYPTMGHKLSEDTFYAFFQDGPQLNEDVSTAGLLNARMLAGFMDTPEYQELHELTSGDLFGSSLASRSVVQNLAAALNKQQKDMAERASQMQAQLDEAQSTLDALQDMPEGQNAELDAMREDASEQASEASAALEELEDALAEDDLKISGHAMRTMAKQASQNITETNEAIEQFARSWGTEAGSEQRLSAEQRLTMADYVSRSKKLKDIAAMLGKLQPIANKVQREKSETPITAVDIETSRNLQRALPSEMLVLDIEEAVFMQRYASGALLTYQLDDEEPQGHGPIVCALDTSGSMGGDPEVWSKAVELATLKLAQKNKRSFCGIHFASAGQTRAWDYEAGNVSMLEALQMAEHFFNGGTDFNYPLAAALDAIEESAYQKADLLFITDGQCMVSPEMSARFQRAKEEKNFSMTLVVIGASVDTSEGQIGALADTTVMLSAILEGSKLTDDATNATAALFSV
jgi:uncharacterized protein with von Willebrand factor type A (vWA) domain